MINLQVLNNIKLSETDHDLCILVIDENLSIPAEDIIPLKDYGNVIVAVNTPMESSYMIAKLSGLHMQVVLTRRIPIRDYDVLISNSFSDMTRVIVKNLKIKYLCFTNFVRNFNLTNYYEFEENSYKLTNEDTPRPHHDHSEHHHPTPPGPPPVSPDNEDDDVTNDESAEENDEANYQAIIKDIASTEMVYDKYRINYLYPLVPRKDKHHNGSVTAEQQLR